MKTFLLIIAIIILLVINNELDHIHIDLHNYVGAPLHP